MPSPLDSFESAAEKLSAENVHKLRTTIRRCEGIVASSSYALSDRDTDALRRLKKVRKAAGEIRDLDIQLGLVHDESLARANVKDSASTLVGQLQAARKNAERKLHDELKKALADGSAKRAEKICRRAAKNLPEDLTSEVHKMLRVLAHDADLNDVEGLHDVRIGLKKVRYALEAQGSSASEDLVKQLKQVHDAVGEWHDWLAFADAAQTHLPRRSPLVIAARRRTASLFVKAVEVANILLAPYSAAKKKSGSAKPPLSKAGARA